MPNGQEAEQRDAVSRSLQERLRNLLLTGEDYTLASGDVITLKAPTQQRYLQAMFAAREAAPDAWERALSADTSVMAGFDMASASKEERDSFLALATVTMASAVAALRVTCADLATAEDELCEAILQSNGGADGPLARRCNELCGGVMYAPGRESDPLD